MKKERIWKTIKAWKNLKFRSKKYKTIDEAVIYWTALGLSDEDIVNVLAGFKEGYEQGKQDAYSKSKESK